MLFRSANTINPADPSFRLATVKSNLTANTVNVSSLLDVTGNLKASLTNATQTNIVYYDSSVKKVYATNFGYDTSSVTTDSGGSASVTSVVPSAFNPNYGTILYLENRKSVSRGVDQIEDVRVVIQY